jgi:carbamoyltransferase
MTTHYTLGISCFYHDSAVCLIKDKEILYASQEERFTRIKHDSSFPINAIKDCLNFSNLTIEKIDKITFYDNPTLKFSRIIRSFISTAPKNFSNFKKATDIWITEKLFMTKLIKKNLKKSFNYKLKNKIYYCDHHTSHAASAFYPSPFQEALVLTIDGVGEWATTTVAHAKNNKIKILKEIFFPHSLGLLYSAFTYYLGFRVNSGEYKVMGLAPYGNPKFENLIFEKLIDCKEDGSFKLNHYYFDFISGNKMINKNFEKLFGEKRRLPEEKLDFFHHDIAASIQKVIEKIVLRITKNIYEEYKIENLCLAGGVALNCVANSKILKQKLFKNVWIQPASGDAGGSLGSALHYIYDVKKLDRSFSENKYDLMKGSYLGDEFSNKEILAFLEKEGGIFSFHNDDDILHHAVNYLKNKKAVGWFQGRMEFGPRALGNRSILADPRCSEMQKKLNIKIKFRESFRPFAPSILEDKAFNWFNLDATSPYMLLVGEVKNKIKTKNDNSKKLEILDQLNQVRSSVPAITHVDYSARIQTVNRFQNKKFYDLLKEFENQTGCPILINTSFNIRGEPIVGTPKDAYRCFMGNDLDYLIIGNYILDKKKQNTSMKKDYKNYFKLD